MDRFQATDGVAQDRKDKRAFPDLLQRLKSKMPADKRCVAGPCNLFAPNCGTCRVVHQDHPVGPAAAKVRFHSPVNGRTATFRDVHEHCSRWRLPEATQLACPMDSSHEARQALFQKWLNE